MVAGFLPLHKGLTSGATVGVEFRESTSTYGGYTAYLHFTAPLVTKAEVSHSGNTPVPDFGQAFFGGRSPLTQQIDEYTLCYPDGHCLNVLPESRKTIPPNTYHL